MDTEMHVHITEKAIEWLNGGAAAYWKPLTKTAAFASNYPDWFASGELLTAEKQKIDPDWRNYILIPEEGGIPAHSMFKPLAIRETYPPLIKYWTENLLSEIKHGNNEKAAKFAGCLSHIIGDTGQTAHVFDDRLLKKLLPQSDACFVIHTALEKVTGHITQKKYLPRLLGTSLEEINWRLIEELEILKLRETAELVPLMLSVLNGDKLAGEVCASKTLTHCAELFSDLLHSLWSISAGDTGTAEESIDLRTLVPTEQFCDMLFNYEVMIDKMPGKDKDKPLPFDPGIGRNVKGIALLANMAPAFKGIREAFAEYSLPSNVFRYFESFIGLNHNAKNCTKAVFEVSLDGKIVFQSAPLGDKDEAVNVRIPLGKAAEIRLYARDARPEPCSTEFFYPVFAEPKICNRLRK